MPIEITRFGVGNRRAGSPGTHGVASQVIHSDARGTIAELAMEREARIEPYTSPNSTWFIVIEGGGWVLVGDEKTRIAAGEAAFWPAGQIHGAWTEHSQLRAFMVELAGPDARALRALQQRVALRVHQSHRIAKACGRCGDELQVELGGRGLRPARVIQPPEDARPARARQLVDLAIGAIRLTHPLGGHEARFFEPAQRHVDLARVQRLGQRAERKLQPRPQLIAVGGLLGEQREQDLLHDAQLIAG